jgi:predicted RecA/RadA family phage recombinase
MKNFIQKGDTVPFTAPAAVVSGQGVLIGAMFGVAVASAASGTPVELQLTGVVEIAKTGGQAWTEGQKLYWSGTSATSVSGPNLIGCAVRAAAPTDAIGFVRLNGTVPT